MPPAFLPFNLTLLTPTRTAGSANPVAFHCSVTIPYLCPTRSARFVSALQSIRTLLSSPFSLRPLLSLPFPLTIVAYLAKVI